MFPPRPTSRQLFLGAVALCALHAATLRAQEAVPGPTPVESVATTAPGNVATPAATVAAIVTPAASPATPPRVLYPSKKASVIDAQQGKEASSVSSPFVTFLVLLAFCVAGYYLLRQHPNFAAAFAGFTTGFKGGERKLNVSESRSLGNRQFLIVVEYENERMLLGVTPGKIDYLCPLRSSEGEPSVFPALKK